jgi:uncharacterized phage protein gp47/JayE
MKAERRSDQVARSTYLHKLSDEWSIMRKQSVALTVARSLARIAEKKLKNRKIQFFFKFFRARALLF